MQTMEILAIEAAPSPEEAAPESSCPDSTTAQEVGRIPSSGEVIANLGFDLDRLYRIQRAVEPAAYAGGVEAAKVWCQCEGHILAISKVLLGK